MVSHCNDHEVIAEAGPNVKVHDNVMFAYDEVVDKQTLLNEMSNLTVSTLSVSTDYLITLREILVTLSLINISDSDK